MGWQLIVVSQLFDLWPMSLALVMLFVLCLTASAAGGATTIAKLSVSQLSVATWSLLCRPFLWRYALSHGRLPLWRIGSQLCTQGRSALALCGALRLQSLGVMRTKL